MPLGPEDIYLYARHAGFSPDQAVTMTAVAMAESGGVLTAHNPVGEDSKGLWQVNMDAHPKFHGLDASDPLTNARMAFEVSGGGGDIGRWTVTHGDKGSPYLKFREQAEAASRAFGENGHGQWNPPANYHAPKVSAGVGGGPPPPAPLPDVVPDDSNAEFTPAFGGSGSNLAQSTVGQPGEGQPAVDPNADIGQDSDSDGLLDRYEKAMGMDAQSVDSDRDGFTDADEIQKFGTDATDFGSNPLGATGGPAPVESVPSTPSSVTDGAGQATATADLNDPGEPAGVGPGPAAAAAVAQPVGIQAVTAGPGPEEQFLGPAAPGGGAPGGNKLDVFLDAMLAQEGDTYVFGAEASADDLDPDTFDCSELVEWAGAQAGVDIPDGSFNQYLHVKDIGAELTVQEALQTPGALLFQFSSTPVPGGGRPSAAHVAISLGDGRTIEARNSRLPVGVMDAGDIDWTHGGFVPELGTELSGDFGPGVVTEPVQPIEMGADSDEDGLLDAYERLVGTDPFNADTDRDGFVDSVEIHDHGTDPLDFTDNALSPGSTGGFRPPLTTDLPPGAEQTPSPFGGTDGVGLAPNTGQSSFPGSSSSTPSPSTGSGEPAPVPDPPAPVDEATEETTEAGDVVDDVEEEVEETVDEAVDDTDESATDADDDTDPISISGDDTDVPPDILGEVDGLTELDTELIESPLTTEADDSGDDDFADDG